MGALQRAILMAGANKNKSRLLCFIGESENAWEYRIVFSRIFYSKIRIYVTMLAVIFTFLYQK